MKYLQEGIRIAQEYLFPVFCLSCDAEGEWLCDSCFSTLDISLQSFCAGCHVYTIDGAICDSCKKQSFIDAHIAAMKYVEEEDIGKIIHALKYEYAEDVMRVIHRIIDALLLQNSSRYFEQVDLIVPVPLHKKRYAERGFNQAEYIAQFLSEKSGIPLADIVSRSRNTPHQARLDRQGRIQNVADAFVVTEDVTGKHILLVDDVLTTGATMQECAKALKQRGVRSVWAFTVARG